MKYRNVYEHQLKIKLCVAYKCIYLSQLIDISQQDECISETEYKTEHGIYTLTKLTLIH